MVDHAITMIAYVLFFSTKWFFCSLLGWLLTIVGLLAGMHSLDSNHDIYSVLNIAGPFILMLLVSITFFQYVMTSMSLNNFFAIQKLTV